MVRVGVICGLKSEADLLSPVMEGDDAPLVRPSGAKTAAAFEDTRALIGLGVDGLVSFGIGGGLDPSLSVGDIVVGTEVVSPDGRRYPTDRAWYERMASVIGKTAPVREGRIAGVDRVAGRDEKRRLFETTGCAVCDMESHAVAEVAAAMGVPFAVLRSISDPVGNDLPGWINPSVRRDGSIDMLPVVLRAVVRPWAWGDLLKLAGGSAKARRNLGGAVGALGPGFGLLAR